METQKLRGFSFVNQSRFNEFVWERVLGGFEGRAQKVLAPGDLGSYSILAPGDLYRRYAMLVHRSRLVTLTRQTVPSAILVSG